ncbi:MAG: PorT family protein, partial [Flavobacteriales bacterium]|nr:PorT family protein [Flavobacteriales bacterium]
AQTRSGPRAGLGIATISRGYLLQWKGSAQLGPIVGWSWEVPWTEQASFLFEPMYIAKGSYVRNAVTQQSNSERLGFVEIPIILKLSISKDKGGVFLSGGIMGGYLVTSKQVVRQNNGSALVSNDYLAGSPRRFQYGVALGAGFDKGNFSFEARAQTSLSPFNPVYQAQNLVVGLHFTYYIPKKADRERKKEMD